MAARVLISAVTALFVSGAFVAYDYWLVWRPQARAWTAEMAAADARTDAAVQRVCAMLSDRPDLVALMSRCAQAPTP